VRNISEYGELFSLELLVIHQLFQVDRARIYRVYR